MTDLVGAATALLRWHLDNADVHPCDYNNDEVRAVQCIPEVRRLFAALRAQSAPQPADPSTSST